MLTLPLSMIRMKEQQERLNLKHESELDWKAMTDPEVLPFSAHRMQGMWYRFSRRHDFGVKGDLASELTLIAACARQPPVC